jgi:hypothetical protein
MFCTYCGADLPKKHEGPCPKCGRTAPTVQGQLAHEGDVLYVPSGVPFPDFCIKCNAPAVGERKKVKLYWHPPALFALILFGLVPYAIVAIITRKKAVIEVPRCERHRSSWTIVAKIGLVLLLLGTAAFAVLIALEVNNPNGAKGPMETAAGNGSCFIIPAAGLIGILMVNFGIRRLSPKKIDEQGNLWVKGVCSEFLDDHASALAPPM